ncbi:MAG: hypothetical protein U0T81_09685 [Saprospiraceae bacterium]
MTSSPPHSVQLIGYHLKKLTGIPWLSDYRDPWTKIFFWDKLKMTAWAKRKNEQLEKNALLLPIVLLPSVRAAQGILLRCH